MASGHVNRIYRPNTWLHRPMLQNVKKALANSEPSTHGTKPTQLSPWSTSAVDAVDGSSTGTRVPRMRALIRPPQFGGGNYASDYDNRSGYRQVGVSSHGID